MLDSTKMTDEKAANLTEMEAMRERGYQSGDLAKVLAMDLPDEATPRVDDRVAEALADALTWDAR